ncbi:hypothetical protein PPACK8108_LOCUS20659 [Phakopsora pachyrhizi]|uniref:Uncharacterized protein n=1 Tax=Phakopsora pachyrhizi TaxID=170000 RepID=A0AAV0BIW8_PHAPC|nr:hypothetical protein PPACK8108_LOCUS20659 [Phakopsora pachyrhizi]
MTVLIDGKLEDPLIKDKKVSLLGGVICGQKISMESVSEGSSCASSSPNLNPESHKQDTKSTLAISYAELYKSKVEDKEQHMELTIREKEIQFAKDGKYKELEVRMLITDKDCEAMKLKEDNALLLAVVRSSRSVEDVTKISKILFNR